MFTQQLSSFVDIAKDKEGNNLKAVILIGSGANNSFVKGASDLDFIFIFEQVDFNTLESMDQLKFEGQSADMLDCSIDIQLLTQAEIKSARNRNATVLFFHNLALKKIDEGHNIVLYQADDADLDYSYCLEGVKEDALYSASYSIFCLRRMLVDGNSKFPPFRSTPDRDFVKLCAGLCKHVIEFCLAYEEVFCSNVQTMVRESQRVFEYDMEPFQRAYDLRGTKDADFDALRAAFELAENIHRKTIALGQ